MGNSMWVNVGYARSSPRFYNARNAVSFVRTKHMKNKIKIEHLSENYISSCAVKILISVSDIEAERGVLMQLETFLL